MDRIRRFDVHRRERVSFMFNDSNCGKIKLENNTVAFRTHAIQL